MPAHQASWKDEMALCSGAREAVPRVLSLCATSMVLSQKKLAAPTFIPKPCRMCSAAHHFRLARATSRTHSARTVRDQFP